MLARGSVQLALGAALSVACGGRAVAPAASPAQPAANCLAAVGPVYDASDDAPDSLRVDVWPGGKMPPDLVARPPDRLTERGIDGSVRLRFVVTRQGTVRSCSIQVLSATDATFAAEARRELLLMRWTPARRNGEAVAAWTEHGFGWRISP